MKFVAPATGAGTVAVGAATGELPLVVGAPALRDAASGDART